VGLVQTSASRSAFISGLAVVFVAILAIGSRRSNVDFLTLFSVCLYEHGFEFLRQEHQDRWMGFRREDIKEWFRSAGLENVIVDCVGENCCTRSSSGSEHARSSIFVARVEKGAT